MNSSSTRSVIAAAMVIAAVAIGVVAAPLAQAEPIANALIAQDTSAAPVAPGTVVVGVDANLPAGLTVRGVAGKQVTVQTAGEPVRTVTASKTTGTAVFTKLTAGKAYTVSIAGKRIGTATPLATPSPAWGLTVSTTDKTGAVALEWKHQLTKAQGKVAYQVTATPRGVDGRSLPSAKAMTAVSTGTSSTLEGLDPTVLYTFTVAPANSAAVGKATTAVMSRSLGDIFGSTKVANDPAPAPVPTVQAPAPAPVAAASSGPAAPSTRTIYVCPDGYTDNAGVCENVMAYTFHTVTETRAYTYTWTKVGQHEVPSTGPCNYLPNPNSPTGLDIYCPPPTVVDDYANVKDATPTGFKDNGTAWTKDTQVRDTMPAGYADTGAAWVKTTAKVAQVVPA